MTETEIRIEILEQMYEHHWREAGTCARCLMFAGDHYTYRDNQRAHTVAAEYIEHEIIGILRYAEGSKRLRAIWDRVKTEHDALVTSRRIAAEKDGK